MNFMLVVVQFSNSFAVKPYFINIDDFGVIFWQKLVISDVLICAINLFFVNVHKKKLRSVLTFYKRIIWEFLLEKVDKN